MGPLDSPEEVPTRAPRSIAGAPAEIIQPEAGPPFSLAPGDGRTLVSLAAWPLAGIARLEDVAVEIPTPAAAGRMPGERPRNRPGPPPAATGTTHLSPVARE